MKKLIIFIAFMAMSLGVQAQETKHELAFTYGFASTSQVMDIFTDLVSAPFKGSTSQEKDWWFGPLSLEYFYHLLLTFNYLFKFSHFAGDIIPLFVVFPYQRVNSAF